MTKTIQIKGFCPAIKVDSKVQPVFDEDEEEFVCEACDMPLGDAKESAKKSFRTHALETTS